MCGIAGLVATQFPAGLDIAEVVRRLVGQLKHRGPDDEGVWVDPAEGIALGHRRLAVIDLSSEGRQPMIGRYVISFNGEIYFAKLQGELKDLGHNFRGHSDTEVVLAAVEQWGVIGALRRCIGMFAFALWYRQEHTVHFTWDRLGEKSFYYMAAWTVYPR